MLKRLDFELFDQVLKQAEASWTAKDLSAKMISFKRLIMVKLALWG